MKYRKRPVVIDAMQMPVDGNPVESMKVYHWVEENTQGSFDVNDPDAPTPESGVSIDAETGFMVIATLEGVMQAKPGDYIIKGVEGEFYPCKPDIFNKTYEPVPGCCSTCKGTGAGNDPETGGRCFDCYGTGHTHYPVEGC